MATTFCCSTPSPYRPAHLTHEAKFGPFIAWAKGGQSSPSAVPASFFQNPEHMPPYAIQFVRQVNCGPVEAKNYFVPYSDPSSGRMDFVEGSEQDLISWNFQKLNLYKNFKCATHYKFFELNLYQKDPINQHHLRLNIARPASDIDL